MGLFDKIKDAASKQQKTSVRNVSPAMEEFTRTYQNADRFKGFRRLYVTVHGDRDGAEEHTANLLHGKDYFNCVNHNITLTGIKTDDSTGIKVSANGFPLGVAWESINSGDVYNAAFAGEIEEVYVRIESGTEHPTVYLFVKMPE